MNTFEPVIQALGALKEDSMVVRRVKERAEQIVLLLQQNSQVSVDKALRELEELTSSEIPSYDRTMLWEAVSLLESLRAEARA